MRNLITAIILLFLLPVNGFCAESKVPQKVEDTTKPKSTKNSPPLVVATIKPIQSLVAGVMGELGTPELLIDGASSEHDYALKPSDMKKLQSADIVFFTSFDLETFLSGTIPSLKAGTTAVELAASEDVVKQLPLASDFEEENHKELYDPHLWMSPQNAIAMVKQIKKILSIKDSKNRGTYEMNAKSYINKIAAISEKITLDFASYKDVPFITFHDAYGYFVKSYGLNQIAAVSLNPETALGAQKISDINDAIRRKHIHCVFADPAFGDAAVKKILNKPEKVKIVTLDPIGQSLEKGAQEYLDMLKKTSENMLACFGNDKI